jgi:hypothetical protein
MYRNNILNIKIAVNSDTQTQDKIIDKKDLLKLQKNIAKYFKVKPTINVLFNDEYVTDIWTRITAITEYSETGIYLRIMTYSDDPIEIRVYDFDILPTRFNVSLRKVNMQNVQ